MKKKYITPEMNVVLLRQKTMLLAGSVLAIDNDDDILNDEILFGGGDDGIVRSPKLFDF